DLWAFAQLPPPYDAVVANIAEEQLIAMPDRPLGKGEAARNPLNRGCFRDQLVKRGAPHIECLCHFALRPPAAVEMAIAGVVLLFGMKDGIRFLTKPSNDDKTHGTASQSGG